jgi:hypothetical protein
MSVSDDKYNHSEKGRTRHRRYNKSPKGRARNARYEASRIRVGAGGYRWSYRVPPQRKAAVQEELAAFRAAQAAEYAVFSVSLSEEPPRR